MKLMRTILAVLLAAALWSPGAAEAGQRAEAFSLSPLVGYHVFDGDQNTDDDFTYGLAAGFNVNKRWAIELDVRYTPTETRNELTRHGVLEEEDVDIWTIGLNAFTISTPTATLSPTLRAASAA